MNTRGFSFKYSMFAAFLGLAFTSFAHAELVDRVVAIVNKKAIYKSDVDQFRKLLPLRAKVDPIFSTDPIAKKANQTDEEVTDFLINEVIITDKFPVADADVEQEINGIQGNLHIDREALRAAIGREGFKFEEYFQLMRSSLSKRQLIDREIRNKAAVSDDDLRAEYNRSQSGSKTFHGSFHVFLLQIPKSKFKTAKLARDEVQKAMDELKKGAAFEAIVKKYNDEEADGDLGYLSYSEMFPALQKEVRKLGPQKMSDIFDDGKNFDIVRVGDVKSEDDASFTKDKDQLRGKLLESEYQHQIQLWLSRQRALNYVKINAKKS